MILTTKHRVTNAIRFKNAESGNMWLIVGGQSAWPDESNPPDPIANEDTINTPMGAVKCALKWVVPDPAGSIKVIGPLGEQSWREISLEADAITEGCRWVMITGSVSGSVIPAGGFREIGYTTGLTPAVGYESDTVLAHANISSYGNLQSVEYRQVVNRNINNSYSTYNIIEF